MARSQTRTDLSAPPEASIRPCGEYAREQTAARWPCRVSTDSPPLRCGVLTDLFSLAFSPVRLPAPPPAGRASRRRPSGLVQYMGSTAFFTEVLPCATPLSST